MLVGFVVLKQKHQIDLQQVCAVTLYKFHFDGQHLILCELRQSLRLFHHLKSHSMDAQVPFARL